MAADLLPNLAGVPSRLRILMIHNILVEKGGAETFFLKQVEVMRRAGFEVCVFGFGDEPGGSPEGPLLRIPEPRSWALRKALKFTFHPGAYRALRAYVLRTQPDLVHLHMNTKYPLAVLLALRGFPVVQTVHSNEMFCPTGWLVHADDREPCEGGAGAKCVRHGCVPAHLLPLHVVLERCWHAAARRVVTHFTPPSRHLASYLERFGFRNVTRIPYFSPVTPSGESPPPASSETILYAGVLTHQKGVEYLIRAMPAVLERRPGARLVIVGDGANEAFLREVSASLELSAAVHFAGRVPNQELARFYGRARVCVIPSVWMENSPLVAYEAMLAGRPIVGSDRGGIPDLIETSGCGFVVPAKDPAAIAERVVQLLESPTLADELGARGRRYATEILSEDAFLVSFGSVMRQALSSVARAAGPR